MSNDALLMQGFAFSAADLAQNKAQQLTPRQHSQVQERLKYQRPAQRIAFGVFAFMAIAASAVPILISGPDTEAARPFLIGFAALIWVIFIAVLGFQRQSIRDLVHARVSVIEGTVRLRQKQVRTPETKLGTAFFMKVGGKQYQLESPEQYGALQDGAAYRFHVVRNGRVPLILSVEAL